MDDGWTVQDAVDEMKVCYKCHMKFLPEFFGCCCELGGSTRATMDLFSGMAGAGVSEIAEIAERISGCGGSHVAMEKKPEISVPSPETEVRPPVPEVPILVRTPSPRALAPAPAPTLEAPQIEEMKKQEAPVPAPVEQARGREEEAKEESLGKEREGKDKESSSSSSSSSEALPELVL